MLMLLLELLGPDEAGVLGRLLLLLRRRRWRPLWRLLMLLMRSSQAKRVLWFVAKG